MLREEKDLMLVRLLGLPITERENAWWTSFIVKEMFAGNITKGKLMCTGEEK